MGKSGLGKPVNMPNPYGNPSPPTVEDIRIGTRKSNMPGTRETNPLEILKILVEDDEARAEMRRVLMSWNEWQETTGKYQDEH